MRHQMALMEFDTPRVRMACVGFVICLRAARPQTRDELTEMEQAVVSQGDRLLVTLSI